MPWMRVWPQISRKLLMLLVFDVFISVSYVFFGATFLAISSLPLSMVGAALSIFLAFRTKSAYDRWWEARILWGALVNSSRTFARQVLTLAGSGPESSPIANGQSREIRSLQRQLVVLQICYVHALRCLLRRQNPYPEIRGHLNGETIAYLKTQNNVPVAILQRMGLLLQMAAERGWIDSFRWVALDKTLTDLTDIQGGCERIKNTPLPKQYDYFPRILVVFFCLLLPFGLVEGLELLTPIASTSLSFIFIALDRIGRDIETPFDNTAHDTPMTSLSRTIELNLRQLLGEQAPVEIHPVAGFVY